MDYNPEDVREYVPDWNDNREKPESEQIVLELAPMTGGELERIIKARVMGITNLSDILGRPVVNGEELWDRAEQPLIDEAYNALTEISTLSKGMKKK